MSSCCGCSEISAKDLWFPEDDKDKHPDSDEDDDSDDSRNDAATARDAPAASNPQSPIPNPQSTAPPPKPVQTFDRHPERWFTCKKGGPWGDL